MFTLIFFEREGESYKRYSESFREIALPDDEVRKMLFDTGFEVLGVYDDYTYDEPCEKTDRLVYVCKKVR